MTTWMMLIVAGPNGAGKTTVTNEVVESFGFPIAKLNADDRTLELRKKHPERQLPDLNLMAAQEIDAEVDEKIKSGKSFYVETVLSSSKYRKAVLDAKEKGFKIALVYVSVHPPKVSVNRVKNRAAKGGHDVEEEKIIKRYHRSHEQLEWFAEQADMFLIFDNSALDKSPILLAAKMAGKEIVHHVKGANPEIDRVIGVLQKRNSMAPVAQP